MSSATAGSGLTWEDYLNLPDDPKYKHAELVDGELVLVNPPSWPHQRMVLRLASRLEFWTEAGTDRGAVLLDPSVRIDGSKAYMPDIAWYREDRDEASVGNAYEVGPPDLAIEVLSPSTRMIDLLRKPRDYARAGVRELWLVDLDGPVVGVLRLPTGASTDSEYTVVGELRPPTSLTSPLLPGLAIPLEALGSR